MATTITRFLLMTTIAAPLALSPARAKDGPPNIHAVGNKTIFIENKGQVTDQYGSPRKDVDFRIAAGEGLNIFLGDGALHYQWARTNGQTEMYRMDVVLLGANPKARVSTEKVTGYTERYYLPATGNSGVLAHTYAKVTYHDVYPNIDWVFYFNPSGTLEHDFIIRPGARVSDIRLQYQGAANLRLNTNGGLTAVTPFGEVTESAPYAYEIKGRRKVGSSFVLKENILSFSSDAYKGTLIIDPTVEWGSYFGGVDFDELTDIALSRTGFAYATGSTNSSANIATTGAHQTVYAGGSNTSGSDAIITKFDGTGNCVWATYYGGGESDVTKKIAIDTAGNIYVAGWTASSSGIATPGSYQPARAGGLDRYNAFLVKLDTAGQRQWATYCGGTNDGSITNPLDIATDRKGNVFLTFTTQSNDIPTTTGAYQSAISGSFDAFVVKFGTTTGQAAWASYYGGTAADYPYALTTDTAGNLYITGRTQSTTGMVTPGTQQTTIGGGQDAFLSKFSPTGSMLWGTYYGGSGVDRGYSVAADDSGNVYLAGVTLSAAGIASAGAHQTVFGGGNLDDGFIAKFNSTGNRIWASYYGGPAADGINDIHYNPNGSIYCTGYTASLTAIANPLGMQPSIGGLQDGFISRFGNDGTLLWGSYYGGIDGDVSHAVSGNAAGDIYICGRTTSGTGIATTGTHQSSFAGGAYDGYLVRIKDCIAPEIPDSISGLSVVCAGSVHTYKAHSVSPTDYVWILPSGWNGTSVTDEIDVTFPGSAGNGTLKLVASNDCDVSDTLSFEITINTLPVTPVITPSGNIVLSTATTYTSYQWNLNGSAIAGATSPTYTVLENGNYTVTVTNQQGCTATSDVFNATLTGAKNWFGEGAIEIFPNPFVDRLQFDLPIAAMVELVDVQGRTVKNWMLKPGRQSLAVDAVAGMYILRIYNVEGNFLGAQKIVKQNNQ